MKISMKFSGMWPMTKLKVTKKHGFMLSIENIFLEKPQGESNWPWIELSLQKIHLFS